MIRGLMAACLGLAVTFGHGAAAQERSAEADANNPLAQLTSFNLQNQYTGELTGVDEAANSVFLRVAQPFRLWGANWITRATLPINTFPVAPDLDHETAIGDFNIFAAYLFDTPDPAISVGIGPLATLPTATDDDLGSEKWSLGFAHVLFDARSPKYQWGYLLQWQASVAGDDDRADVNIGFFQPFGFYQLGQGWYLRSTGIWTYDFESDAYSIPVGLGLGKVIQRPGMVTNVFLEPQYSVATDGDGQPEWGAFFGINFQFPSG